MRVIVCGILLFSMITLTHADLAGDLRQLRNTISETAKTGKELGSLTGGNDGHPQNGNATGSTTFLPSLNEGDILVAKIANIKLFKEPSKKAESVATLTKHDELLYTGSQVDGFYSVTTGNKGEGWVEKILVKRR
jgi:hypothetical protein